MKLYLTHKYPDCFPYFSSSSCVIVYIAVVSCRLLSVAFLSVALCFSTVMPRAGRNGILLVSLFLSTAQVGEGEETRGDPKESSQSQRSPLEGADSKEESEAEGEIPRLCVAFPWDGMFTFFLSSLAVRIRLEVVFC